MSCMSDRFLQDRALRHQNHLVLNQNVIGMPERSMLKGSTSEPGTSTLFVQLGLMNIQHLAGAGIRGVESDVLDRVGGFHGA